MRPFPFLGPDTDGSAVHFLCVGKEKLGGLLHSPLIILNDSNGPETYLQIQIHLTQKHTHATIYSDTQC